MATLYYVQDGSASDYGWFSSRREAVAARASVARTCGREFAKSEIEEHEVKEMRLAVLERLSESHPAGAGVRRVAQREIARRERQARIDGHLLSWTQVREILGREYEGEEVQDAILAAWLRRRGAGEWVLGAQASVSDEGWLVRR